MPEARKSAGRAWLFSLLMPGAGQLYLGAGIRGPAVLAMFLVALGVTILVPGDARWLGVRLAIMLYAFASYDAYETARERNAGIDVDTSDNPRVAALLNLTTNGFGYVYLGHKWGFAVFLFMVTIGRVIAGAVPLLAELLVAGLAVHAWVIGRRKRDEIYPPSKRPAEETKLPRVIPAVVAGVVLASYYALVVVGQIALWMKR